MQGKHFHIMGMGKAGKAAHDFLQKQNATVTVWDDNNKFGNSLSVEHIGNSIDAVVMSPGIPLTHPQPHPVVNKCAELNIPIISDIHLLYAAQPSATYIGITGTNGKSTTTALLTHILQQAGLDAVMGGNIGVPVCALEKHDIYVLELSSYQIDLLYYNEAWLKPPVFKVAGLLNITPDHIDRHGDMAGYVQAKKQLLDHAQTNVIAVEDNYTKEIATTCDNVVAVTHDMAQETPLLMGNHNKQNIALACAMAEQLGVENPAQYVAGFSPLEHRLQWVRAIGKVDYINDSKATNAVSTEKALQGMAKPVYWILGGVAKEGGVESLKDSQRNVEHAFVIGQSADLLAAQLTCNYTVVKTLDMAVKQAHNMAQAVQQNAVVLLSPACASFDSYANFEARGDHFITLVKAL